MGFHADFAHPAADLFAAAVDDDRFEADQFEEDHILDDIFL